MLATIKDSEPDTITDNVGLPAMALHPTTLLPWIATLLVVLLGSAVHQRRKTRHLPPGPRPLPILGNLLDMPRVHYGQEFASLTERFG